MSLRKQAGGALVALAAVLTIAVAGTLVSAFSLSKLRMNREQATTKALAEVREALIAWSVTHPKHPGMLPYPDRANDGNYDGNSDCVTAAPAMSHLLGRVPWLGQTNPCPLPHSGLATAQRDGSGAILWIAVSRNLVHVPPGNYPAIDLALRDAASPTPWMRVVDASGSTLSSRAAVVLLAPGLATGIQVRAGAAPGTASYLDVLAGYDNADNQDLTFVAAAAQGTFNDRVVYLTADDWIRFLIPRVVFELRRALEGYRAATGSYPEFAAPAVDGVCASGTASGFLPFLDGNCGSSLAAFIPTGQLGTWLQGWVRDVGYRRDTPVHATLVIDGVSHAITP